MKSENLSCHIINLMLREQISLNKYLVNFTIFSEIRSIVFSKYAGSGRSWDAFPVFQNPFLKWGQPSVITMNRVFPVILTILVVSRSVEAGLVFSDGKVHTLAGINPDVLLLNGSSLVVPTGASVIAASGFAGIQGSDGVGETVTLSGGRIAGVGVDQFGVGNFGVELTGTLNVTSGSITGGNGTTSFAAAAAAVTGSANISGGTFTSGVSGPSSVGRGIGLAYGGNAFADHLAISGGTFTGLASNPSNPGAMAGEGLNLSLAFTTGNITGGVFVGQNSLSSRGLAMEVFDTHGFLVISGGQFDGDLKLSLSQGGVIEFLGTNLTYSYSSSLGYGMLTGSLFDGSPFSSRVYSSDPGPIQVSNFNGGIFFGLSQPVPEPASLVLLIGMGGMGTLVYGLRSGMSFLRQTRV